MTFFTRDPEELGEEAYEDVELRMDTQQSIHTFDPDPDTGKCRAHLIRHGVQGVVCNSSQRSSIFHDDPDAAHREAHWHGGGDCMCFEDDDGSSYDEPSGLSTTRYTVVLALDVTSDPSRWDWTRLLDLARSDDESVSIIGIVPA